jgi:hypothetical protein
LGQAGHPAGDQISGRNARARQTRQLRAGSSHRDDLKSLASARGLQIQDDFTGFDPKQMMPATIMRASSVNREDVDMPCLDLKHLFVVIEQPRMTRVEQHALAPIGGGCARRKLLVGRQITHSLATSFA